MKNIDLSVKGLDLDYGTARSMAKSVARMLDKKPALIAWHDKPRATMGPAIEGADVNTRWHDYGESFGGNVEVNVNDDYQFVFAESEGFETVEELPFVNVRDRQGNVYLCHRRVVHPEDGEIPAEECTKLEESMGGSVGG